jgi:hypothetical protein
VPTTQISLIREHTEKIVPPRALWVSFELSRPLGVPGDAAFQTRVLSSALELLEAPSGPVLADYPEDAPPVDGPAALVCPVNFDLPASEMGDVEKLSASFLEELTLMRPWYDMAVNKRMRTTVGLNGMEPDAMGSFVAGLLDGAVPSSVDELSPGDMFKLAVEDLKSFYFEAATAQPGQEGADSDTLADWFWRETVAGKVLFAVRDAHAESEDESLRLVVNRSLIPRAHSGFSPFDASQ